MEMISTYFVLLYTLQKVYCSSETYFECGAHGKFEYCIDGVPGCVVGCHCYPGYYFDTETKICEPNIKLTQYRRHYNTEPTRVPLVNIDYVTLPTPSTKSLIDEKVDSIKKDSDDLGDWLYNQFFKTIETQVINKNDSEIKTRRGGSQSNPIKFKRKSHKRNKKSRRKKNKKKGLKSKLLQITEDDSLFDSSSDSSSSDSDGTDSSSCESDESESSDHGHRKILMINKKPTPPLPSFIFLPNVETPFYPPIGLAAPALPMAPMPMYPMVPVPPMGMPSTDGSTTLSTLNTTTESTSTTSVITTSTEGQSNTEAPKDSERARNRDGRIPNFPPIGAKRKPHRNKLIQRLRGKIKNKRPHMEKYQDLETPVVNDIEQSMELEQGSPFARPPQDGVDFEYLSQLIHKININETIPKSYRNANPDFLKTPNMVTRRLHFQDIMPNIYQITKHKQRPASKADEVNDSYYTNLGKQIASLIRTVDSNGEHEINVEIHQQPTDSPIETMFNENRYNPQSYWERFVRSPLKFLLDKLSLRNGSDNLVKIENQVSMAAAIERSLSLRELENIVNQMEYSQTKIANQKNYQPEYIKGTNPKSMYNLDINLLPLTTIRNDANLLKTLPESSLSNNMERIYNMNNNHQMRDIPKNTAYVNNKTIVKEGVWARPFEDIKEIKFPNNFLKAYQLLPAHQQAARKNVTYTKPFRGPQTINFPQNPVLLNYKSVNLVANNRNTFQVEPFSPFNGPFSNHRKSLGITIKPSYFDNFNEFDYFN